MRGERGNTRNVERLMLRGGSLGDFKDRSLRRIGAIMSLWGGERRKII